MSSKRLSENSPKWTLESDGSTKRNKTALTPSFTVTFEDAMDLAARLKLTDLMLPITNEVNDVISIPFPKDESNINEELVETTSDKAEPTAFKTEMCKLVLAVDEQSNFLGELENALKQTSAEVDASSDAPLLLNDDCYEQENKQRNREMEMRRTWELEKDQERYEMQILMDREIAKNKTLKKKLKKVKSLMKSSIPPKELKRKLAPSSVKPEKKQKITMNSNFKSNSPKATAQKKSTKNLASQRNHPSKRSPEKRVSSKKAVSIKSQIRSMMLKKSLSRQKNEPEFVSRQTLTKKQQTSSSSPKRNSTKSKLNQVPIPNPKVTVTSKVEEVTGTFSRKRIMVKPLKSKQASKIVPPILVPKRRPGRPLNSGFVVTASSPKSNTKVNNQKTMTSKLIPKKTGVTSAKVYFATDFPEYEQNFRFTKKNLFKRQFLKKPGVNSVKGVANATATDLPETSAIIPSSSKKPYFRSC